MPQVQGHGKPLQLLSVDAPATVLASDINDSNLPDAPDRSADALPPPLNYPPGLQWVHGAGQVQELRPDPQQAAQGDDRRGNQLPEQATFESAGSRFVSEHAKSRIQESQTPEEQRPDRGSGVPGLAGVQALPGDAQEDGGSLLASPSVEGTALRPAQPRRIASSIRRCEQVWTEIGKGLGPEAATYLPVLKSRVLEDTRRPSKSKLAYYQEVFQMSAKQLKTVAEVFCPNRFVPRAHKHGLNGGKAFDIVLGHDLAQPQAQEAVISYIKHRRPGLCVVCPPCGPFSQLNNLHKHFREQNLAGMKRYLKKNSDGKKLLTFAMKVCRLCYDLGSVFLFEHPWGASSWQSDCVAQLLRLPGVQRVRGDQCMFGLQDSRKQLLRKRTGFMTNHASLALKLQRHCSCEHDHSWIMGFQDGEAKSARAQHYPVRLIDAMLAEYARSMCLDANSLQITSHQDVVDQDARIDKCYYTPSEYLEVQQGIDHQDPSPMTSPQEVWHQDDDGVPVPDPAPTAAGLTDEQLENPGRYELSEGRVALVVHESDRVPLPEEGIEPLHWRTTYSRVQGQWTVIEDELRWQDLHQRSPKVRQSEVLVSVYARHLGVHRSRRLRHFPGLQNVSLERLVRRAHDGLGHPETERFIRILKHGNAPSEVIDIAKNLKCSVCQAYKLPNPARRGAPPRESYAVNDLVGIDTVHLRNHDNVAVPALNIIDRNSHFQLMVPMRQETAECVQEAYRQWIKFFGPPRQILNDLGTEFRGSFSEQAERDGSEVLPSSLEAPTQRGLTERAGGLFKDLLYKAMATYSCSNLKEWQELVDVTCMVRNRLLLRGGYSPIQRVLGFTPRLPGGLLTGGEHDIAVADLQRIGDVDAHRAMRMRKAAAVAFHESDCDQAIRAAALAGRRRFQNFEVGHAVYYWRRGAGTSKKTRSSYWHGPGRILLTNLPSTVWIAHGNSVIKASPERVRIATEEESLSISGWLCGITQAREAFEKVPKKNYVDLSKDTDHIDDLPEDEEEGHPEPEQPAWAPPVRRVCQKTGDYAIPEERSREEEDDMMNPFVALEAAASQETEPSPEKRDSEPAGASASSFPEQDRKREPEEPAEPPPGKRSRIELLEIYNLQMQSLIKQRARKKARVKDFRGPDAVRLQRAITKEITNNLLTGAYELLSAKDSKKVIETKSDKIMSSRYVFTKKPLRDGSSEGRGHPS